ncbi:substrate-binding periplasmic protein [Pseudoalteromonas luteoviolacea]|uniref:substrate-binding periplasmic protein n=1 Tax=Pseudoalteromonas luteoviolacea TaxID=43657 RepID=UPI00114EA709|nr:transporter substrate-binding domain-containing protein [Pseudoalteromonas luteoviolacea]TQF71152.1 transporter substrate-binding domain-containing protein [Pseudoalteromonas luteoviolacea]
MSLFVIFCTKLVACEKSLKVSVSSDWPPYSSKSEGAYHGLEIQLIELITREAGFCVQYVVLPSSSRTFKELQEGNVDIVPAASFTQSRRKYAEFSLPYRQEVMLLFAHKSNALPFLSNGKLKGNALYSNLQNNIVAVSRGSVYGKSFSVFRNNCPDCVIETNLARERFNLVLKKRVEYVVEDNLTGAFLIQKGNYAEHIQPTAISVYNNPVHYMIRPGSLTEQQLQRFNLAIIKNRDTIEQIINDYHVLYNLK